MLLIRRPRNRSAPNRHRLAAPLAVALIVAVGPVLAGCSGGQVQGIVKEASGGTVDVGGSTVPDDFPASVPLPEGEVVNASRVGTGSGKVWNVTVKVAAATPDGIATALSDAGFRATSDIPGLPALGGNAGYTNDEYGVAVVVTDDLDDSYTANFSVVAVPK